MTIYPIVWVILGGVLAAIIVFGAIANLIDAGSGLWARLAPRYPAQPVELDAEKGVANLYLSTRDQWQKLQQPQGCLTIALMIPLWPLLFWKYRPQWYNIRYALGPDHLHLELAQGKIGLSRPMSIPWAALEPLGRGAGHLGEMGVFAVDEMVLRAPIRVLERELQIRRETGAPIPGDDPDAGIQSLGIDAPPRKPPKEPR